MFRAVEDLTGRLFPEGRPGLRVDGRAATPPGRRGAFWFCTCLLCGRQGKVVSAGNLRSGSTFSCGCRRRAVGRELAARRTQRKCLGCGALFFASSVQLYHSRACKEYAALVERRLTACASCGAAIWARKNQRYCSDACKVLGRVTEKTCLFCGADLVALRLRGDAKKKRLCSPECRRARRARADYRRQCGPSLDAQMGVLALLLGGKLDADRPDRAADAGR